MNNYLIMDSAVSRIFFLLFSIPYSIAQIQNNSTSCPSSSCGNITTIRYPFRLNSDPSYCGYNHPFFVLECQNNQTFMNASVFDFYNNGWILQNQYVQEINYDHFSIRISDPVSTVNTSSCPNYTYSMLREHPENVYTYSSQLWEFFIVFVHCMNPVVSSLRYQYVNGPFCGNSSNSSTVTEYYSYVVAGRMGDLGVNDLENTCMIDRIYPASFVENTSSLSSIYRSLANGFELSWSQFDECVQCPENSNSRSCAINGNGGVLCIQWCDPDSQNVECTFNPDSRIGYNYCKVQCWGFQAMINIGLFGIGPMIALRLLIGFPFLVGLVVYKWRRRHLSMEKSIEDFLQAQNNLTPIKYTYSEIKKMTDNFNQKLGEGGYGTVYKGKLRSGPYVAVKMLGKSVTNYDEFISEVGTIGRIYHVNIVQLVGFCVEGSKCALVYEYLENGSLDRYIFFQQALDGLVLTYSKMFEIALGVARGIDYLHRGCDMQILHFDIKPHNILLDENFDPKISDFGLAKLYPPEDSFINLTSVRGTMGYMAPEMFYKNIGGVSYKADVYSFGMLLMEMAGRRKNMNPFAEDVSQIYFPLWVYDQINDGNEIAIMDGDEEEWRIVKRIILVALWCIQMKPSNRPSMNKVVEMLEGDSELQMPPKPFLAPREISEDPDIDESTID